jgi:hypothetical protein
LHGDQRSSVANVRGVGEPDGHSRIPGFRDFAGLLACCFSPDDHD